MHFLKKHMLVSTSQNCKWPGGELNSSGGILYSVFQDIAPGIRMENHWLPPLGAILGFLVGLVGAMLEAG